MSLKRPALRLSTSDIADLAKLASDVHERMEVEGEEGERIKGHQGLTTRSRPGGRGNGCPDDLRPSQHAARVHVQRRRYNELTGISNLPSAPRAWVQELTKNKSCVTRRNVLALREVVRDLHSRCGKVEKDVQMNSRDAIVHRIKLIVSLRRERIRGS